MLNSTRRQFIQTGMAGGITLATAAQPVWSANANNEVCRDGGQTFLCLRDYFPAIQRHPHVSKFESYVRGPEHIHHSSALQNVDDE